MNHQCMMCQSLLACLNSCIYTLFVHSILNYFNYSFNKPTVQTPLELDRIVIRLTASILSSFVSLVNLLHSVFHSI